jgi:hypothetical protein
MGNTAYYYDHKIENLSFILNNSYLFHAHEKVYEKEFCKMYFFGHFNLHLTMYEVYVYISYSCP